MSTRQADSAILVTPNGIEGGWTWDGTTLSFTANGTVVASFTAAGGPTFPVGNLRERINTDVVAAGSTQADAAAVLEGLTVVTGADGTKGVVLTGMAAGGVYFIKGTAAAVLKIWPPVGGTINALSANAALSLASGAIPVIIIAKSATQAYTFPLVAS